MEFPNISFDLETLGVTPGAAVIAIGAVAFDINTGMVDDDKFYCNINPRSCKRAGLHEEESTLAFWADPAQAEAKKRLEPNQLSLKNALGLFSSWLADHTEGGECNLWSRGYMDEEVLGYAYRAIGVEEPWHYRAPRDARTFLDIAKSAGYLFGVCDPEEYMPHFALDDAWLEAKLISAAYQQLVTRGGRDGRITPEIRRLLDGARDEIVSLRARLGAAEPKAHAYDTLAQYARLSSFEERRGAGVDIAWQIKQAIDRDEGR